MDGGTEEEAAIGGERRCAAHPEIRAIAVCSRCGDFQCADCHKPVAGLPLCPRCRDLPGIDYLAETRRALWGKRDGFVWFVGVLMVLDLIGLAIALRNGHGDAEQSLSGVLFIAIAIPYVALRRPARLALVVYTVVDMAADVVRRALGMPMFTSARAAHWNPSTRTAVVLGLDAFVLLVAIAAYYSSRNKLAFRIELDERQLQRVYDRHVRNRRALRSAVLGALALLVPLASAVTLVMGISALRAANPDARPPRTSRIPAIIGIVLSIVGLLFWAMVIFGRILIWRRGHH